MKYLSRNDLETIGGRVIAAYKRLPAISGQALERVDIDFLCQELLGLRIDYECERDFAVWMRFDSFPVLEDCTVIFGHTPTIRFQYDNPMAIWDAKSWIGIDCGCMLPEKGDPWSGALGRLSCLRLDDMQVFYSEEPQYDNLKESEEQHYG